MTNKNSQSRAGARITLIAIHTNEGANAAVLPDLAAENLITWMEANGVSYHAVADDDSCPRQVSDDRASWSLRSGNNRSLNLCFVGYARWTRADWLAHPWMLELGARQVASWAVRYGIPIVKLTPAQVGADQSGICGHIDWTLGKHDGTHTDPGTGFPWDVFLDVVRKHAYQASPPVDEDDMLQLEFTKVDKAAGQWVKAVGIPRHWRDKDIIVTIAASHTAGRIGGVYARVDKGAGNRYQLPTEPAVDPKGFMLAVDAHFDYVVKAGGMTHLAVAAETDGALAVTVCPA